MKKYLEFFFKFFFMMMTIIVAVLGTVFSILHFAGDFWGTIILFTLSIAFFAAVLSYIATKIS